MHGFGDQDGGAAVGGEAGSRLVWREGRRPVGEAGGRDDDGFGEGAAAAEEERFDIEAAEDGVAWPEDREGG